MVETPEKKPRIKLPSLSTVKKALYADWALRVKQRDSWNCLLCDGSDNLTAHHWYVCDHHAHAARYCVHNGATLCYACHIRGVHQRADWTTVNRLWSYMAGTAGFSESQIAALAATELTTEILRRLWDEMRARPVLLDDCEALVDMRGKKMFLSVDADRPIAVVGSTVVAPGFGLCEVTAITAVDCRIDVSDLATAIETDAGLKRYRYTLRRL